MTAAPASRHSYFVPALDGVRGFAFLLVLLAHFSNHYGGPFQGIGKVGVWIFFTLSAFLLTHRLLKNDGDLSQPLLADYVFRRFMRIIPLYYLTLMIYLPFGYVITQTNILRHILFLEGAGHLWTIAAELQFYVLLPAIVWLWIMLAQRAEMLANSCLCAAWFAALLLFPASDFPVSSHLVLPYLTVFTSGVLAAIASLHLREVPGWIWSLVTAAALLMIVATTPSIWSLVAGPTKPDMFYRSQASFGLIAAALILGVALSPGSWSVRLFGAWGLRKLGQVSFSGYLIHPLVLRQTSWLADVIGTPSAVLTSAAATLGAAWLLFSFVEAPLMRLKRPTKIAMKVPHPDVH